MKIEDILTLIKAVSDSELTEIEFTVRADDEGKEGGAALETFRAVKAAREVIVQTSGDAGIQNGGMYVPLEKAAAEKEAADGEYITSPMVGTFYEAPSEGAEPYISVGDTVKKGQVIGIVEAMKLMNEIESPLDGIVEEILVKNKEMVGFEQELVKVKTN